MVRDSGAVGTRSFPSGAWERGRPFDHKSSASFNPLCLVVPVASLLPALGTAPATALRALHPRNSFSLKIPEQECSHPELAEGSVQSVLRHSRNRTDPSPSLRMTEGGRLPAFARTARGGLRSPTEGIE